MSEPNFSIEGALSASEQGKIHEWVVSYLTDVGNNRSLAQILEKGKKYCLGCRKYPLNEVK